MTVRVVVGRDRRAAARSRLVTSHRRDTVPAPSGFKVETRRQPYDEAGTALDGFLARDAALDGPRPAVLVLHDWTGEQEYTRVRVEMLARLGYVAFAADLYGTGIRPSGDEAPATEAGKYYQDLPLLRRRVQAAFDVLASDDQVDPTRIAVVGYCFGGSATLEFLRSGAPVAAAVSFHGILVTHDPADVDDVKAPLLVLTGAADPVVPDAAVAAFQDELRQNPDIDWQINTYSGAPHAFTLPETPYYRPAADASSWQAMRYFLDEHLSEHH